MGLPSYSYGTSLVIWDHTCSVTCHPTQVNDWTCPALTPDKHIPMKQCQTDVAEKPRDAVRIVPNFSLGKSYTTVNRKFIFVTVMSHSFTFPEGRKAELTYEVTRQCTGRESNSRSLDHKSDAQTTTLPTDSASLRDLVLVKSRQF